MPYLIGNINYESLYNFLIQQQQWYLYSDRVWVQHIDQINQCTTFVYQNVEIDDCNQKSAFICEIGTYSIYLPLVLFYFKKNFRSKSVHRSSSLARRCYYSSRNWKFCCSDFTYNNSNRVLVE